jgi:general secretion pathway protein G
MVVTRVSLQRGFTLIELLVVLAVIAILAAMVAPNYLDRVGQAREVALRHDLAGLRTAIDQFYRDKGRYPNTLSELVDARYVRDIPEDPLTERRDTWVVVAPGRGQAAAPAGKVFDIKSGATGQAADGTAYASW